MNRKCHPFTLLEMAVTVFLLLLLSGVALSLTGRTDRADQPEFIVRKIEWLLATHLRNAAETGTVVLIRYHSEKNELSSEEYSEKLLLPTSIQLRCPGSRSEIFFLCRPDGSLSGPEVELFNHGSSIGRWKVSPLTGRFMKSTKGPRP